MAENLDPNKYHVLNKKSKKLVFFISLILLILVVPPLLYLYYNFALDRPSQTADETTFRIEKGENIFDVSSRLYVEDAINSRFLLPFYVLVTGVDDKIQAGVYMIPAGSSVREVADMFQHGTEDVRITFLEGWRVEEFALEASSIFDDIDYEEFVSIAVESEGYLFPDTYLFNVDVTAEEMIEFLKDTFDSKTKDLLTEKSLQKANLTREQAVIFASIVEREVSDPTDRPIVAGILINRWKQGTFIGADATTQYIVSYQRQGCSLDDLRDSGNDVCPIDDLAKETVWWPNDLSVSEIQLTNPYNTRAVVGLPPAPISSVGISALEAVVNYKDTNYGYYLTDKDGITHYSTTLEEHNQAVARYL